MRTDATGKVVISEESGPIDVNATVDLGATVLDLTNSDPLTVAIVDNNGDQISSFGGGTQYTEGDTDASITGTAALMEVAANELRPVQGTVADGLLVNLGSNNDVTLGAALPAGNNNIGDVDIASIAAGDNNIGNVDIVTMPSVTIGALPNEGQQTMANSISTATSTDNRAGYSVGGDLSFITPGDTLETSALGRSGVTFQISDEASTMVGFKFAFEATLDSITYHPLPCYSLVDDVFVTETTSPGLFKASCAGYSSVRIRLVEKKSGGLGVSVWITTNEAAESTAYIHGDVKTQGLVSDLPQSYVEGEYQPLSLNSEGRLRVATVPANVYMDLTPEYRVTCNYDDDMDVFGIPSGNPWS